MSYLHQDASRAQFEIDQSYVLLISQAEGASHHSEDWKSSTELSHLNETLIKEFQEKIVQKPTLIHEKDAHDQDARARGVLTNILHGKKGGLFIHCCYSARDSVATASYLNAVYEWKTLIMEGDRSEYKILLSQSHSFSLANVVLSSQINFTTDSLSRKLHQTVRNIAQHPDVRFTEQAQDFPLSFVATSLGRTTVDWLDLNTRGTEFGILKALFESDCIVDVVSVDMSSNREAVVNLLTERGYTIWEEHGKRGVFYNGERLRKTDKHDLSPLLEKLRQDKMNRIKQFE